MMAGYDGTFRLSVVVAVGTFLLVPAHGSAQDSRPDPCAGVSYQSPLDELTFVLGVMYRCVWQNLLHLIRREATEGAPPLVQQPLQQPLDDLRQGDLFHITPSLVKEVRRRFLSQDPRDL